MLDKERIEIPNLANKNRTKSSALGHDNPKKHHPGSKKLLPSKYLNRLINNSNIKNDDYTKQLTIFLYRNQSVMVSPKRFDEYPWKADRVGQASERQTMTCSPSTCDTQVPRNHLKITPTSTMPPRLKRTHKSLWVMEWKGHVDVYRKLTQGSLSCDAGAFLDYLTAVPMQNE